MSKLTVPTLTRQVTETPPLISTPQISGPVRGAFGEDVGKATENLGRSIGDVASGLKYVENMLVKQKEDQNRVDDAKRENMYIKAWQDRLYSQEMEEVKNPADPGADPRSIGTPKLDTNGQPLRRPRGYLVRSGEEVDINMPSSMIQDNANIAGPLLSQIKDPKRREALAIKLDNHFVSIREKGIQHTITETRKGKIRNFEQSRLNYIDSAVLADSPESLRGLLQNVDDTVASQEKTLGMGLAWSIKESHDDKEKVLFKAANSVLESTGDINKAKELLNSPELKQLIPEDLYPVIEDKLNASNSRIESVQKSLRIKQEYTTRIDTFNKFISGEYNATNSSDVVKQLTISDPELGIALQKAIKSQAKPFLGGEAKAGHYEEEEKNIDFAEAAKLALSSATSQQDRGEFLLNILKDKSNLSVDKLAVLSDLSMLIAQESKNGKNDASPVKTEKQNAIISGVKGLLSSPSPLFSSFNLLSTYVNLLKGGKTPQEAHSEAIKNEITRVNPQVTKYKIGDVVTNRKGESAEIISFDTNTGVPIVRKRISGKPNKSQ